MDFTSNKIDLIAAKLHHLVGAKQIDPIFIETNATIENRYSTIIPLELYPYIAKHLAFETIYSFALSSKLIYNVSRREIMGLKEKYTITVEPERMYRRRKIIIKAFPNGIPRYIFYEGENTTVTFYQFDDNNERLKFSYLGHKCGIHTYDVYYDSSMTEIRRTTSQTDSHMKKNYQNQSRVIVGIFRV